MALIVYKSNDLTYAFHWPDICPEKCFMYSLKHGWWNNPLSFKHFKILKEAADEDSLETWSETNLLDVLVTTGWTEKQVLKVLLDQVPNGWGILNIKLQALGVIVSDGKDQSCTTERANGPTSNS